MRILILSRDVPSLGGGIAAFTATIAPALAARGHDVHVLSCAPGYPRADTFCSGFWWHTRPLRGVTRAERLTRAPQTTTRLAAVLASAMQMRRIAVRFDVVESPEWFGEGLLIALRGRTPVVVNLHTPLRLISEYNGQRLGLDRKIADLVERAVVRRATVVTSPSELISRRLMEDGWLSTAPRLVRLPVDLAPWTAAQPADRTGPTVLVVGRIERRKGPETVVEAAARLKSEIPDLQVAFVGASSGHRDGVAYREWVERIAARCGVAAQFFAHTDAHSVAAMYSRARVVAVPSQFESFSMSLVEAMAAGRPVVFSSQVGAGELVAGTDAGRMVPPSDPAALAAALRPYLTDPRAAARSGAVGRDIVSRHCSPAVIAAQREACYEDAILGSRRR